MPDWFKGPDHPGYECLEHLHRTPIQTIFSDPWPKFLLGFLNEFDRHYGPGNALLEVDTGINGTCGKYSIRNVEWVC